jgi:hypothetical protein
MSYRGLGLVKTVVAPLAGDTTTLSTPCGGFLCALLARAFAITPQEGEGIGFLGSVGLKSLGKNHAVG